MVLLKRRLQHRRRRRDAAAAATPLPHILLILLLLLVNGAFGKDYRRGRREAGVPRVKARRLVTRDAWDPRGRARMLRLALCAVAVLTIALAAAVISPLLMSSCDALRLLRRTEFERVIGQRRRGSSCRSLLLLLLRHARGVEL